jgi:hypothetical protein
MAQQGCDASAAITYLKKAAVDRDAREVAAGLVAGAVLPRGAALLPTAREGLTGVA